MQFSVIIPARNEEAFIGACLDSIRTAAVQVVGEVEIVVVLNRCTDRTEAIARSSGAVITHEDAKNLSRIRNAGARVSRGEYLVTIDADSRMSPNMLSEIARHLDSGRMVGGGVLIRPERLSLGILCSGLLLIPLALWYRISAGLFWCRRDDFDAIGGFDETYTSAEDIDFAVRLRRHGRENGRRFCTLFRASIITSCRKFDEFGDWYFFRNPRMMWSLLKGRNPHAANRIWYDVKR